MTITLDETTAPLVREVTIDLVDLSTIKARIKKLNRRAVRLGLPEITFVEIAHAERRHVGYGLEVSIKVPTVTLVITGRTPKLPGGWKFLGSIEHLGEAGNLVHGDDDRLSAWRTAGPDCSHCASTRSRKKTVILEDKNSALIQVGSTCLKDFLGHNDPIAIVDFEADFYDLDEFDGNSGGNGFVETLRLLVIAAASIRANGWAAKSSGAEATTAAVVEVACRIRSLPVTGRNGEESSLSVHFKRMNVTDEDVKRAETVLAWVRAIPQNEANNYLANLRVIGSQDVIDAKHIGTLISAESAMVRAVEAEAARADADANKCAIPEVGRIVITGEILRMKYTDTPYGETHKMLVQVTTDAGVYKLWGSVPSALDGEVGFAEQGDTVTFTATVERSHNDEAFGFFKRPSKASKVTTNNNEGDN